MVTQEAELNLFVAKLYVFNDTREDKSTPLEKQPFDEKYQRFLRVKDDKGLSAQWAKEETTFNFWWDDERSKAKRKYPLAIYINDDRYYCSIDGEWTHEVYNHI